MCFCLTAFAAESPPNEVAHIKTLNQKTAAAVFFSDISMSDNITVEAPAFENSGIYKNKPSRTESGAAVLPEAETINHRPDGAAPNFYTDNWRQKNNLVTADNHIKFAGFGSDLNARAKI